MKKIALFSFLILLFGCQNDPKQTDSKTVNEQERLSVKSSNQRSDDGTELIGEDNKVDQNMANHDFQIKKPLNNVEVPATTFEFYTNEKDSVFIHHTGSMIQVPANTFEYTDGKKPNKVLISYREFHSPAEIILSGIPMKWDSAGTMVDFASGGMFEFKASDSKGVPLRFAKGKSVSIDLVSKSKANNYNFYAFAENKGWNQLKKKDNCKSLTEAEWRAAQMPKGEEVKKPIKPIKADEDKQLINLQQLTKLNHEYEVFASAFWQPIKEDSSTQKKITAIQTQEWKHIQILPDSAEFGQYNIELIKPKTRISFKAKPVFVGKMFGIESEAYKEKLKKFNNYINRIRNYKKSAALASKFNSLIRRSTTIQSTGIYNYDRQFKRENRVDFIADFESENTNISGGAAVVYLITGEENNAVIKYPSYQWNLFAVDFTESNILIALDEKGKVAALNNEALFEINRRNSFSSNKRNDFLFGLLDHNKAITTPEELDQLINSL